MGLMFGGEKKGKDKLIDRPFYSFINGDLFEYYTSKKELSRRFHKSKRSYRFMYYKPNVFNRRNSTIRLFIMRDHFKRWMTEGFPSYGAPSGAVKFTPPGIFRKIIKRKIFFRQDATL